MVEKTNQKLEHNYESAQKRFKNIKNKKETIDNVRNVISRK